MLYSYVWFWGRYYFCIRIPQPHCSNYQVDLSCKSAICQRAATNHNTPPLFTECHCNGPQVWHLRTSKVGKDCSRCCRIWALVPQGHLPVWGSPHLARCARSGQHPVPSQKMTTSWARSRCLTASSSGHGCGQVLKSVLNYLCRGAFTFPQDNRRLDWSA